MKKWFLLLTALNAVLFLVLVLAGGTDQQQVAGSVAPSPLEFNNLELRVASGSGEPTTTGVDSAPDMICLWVGPFASSEEAQSARVELATDVAQPEVREVPAEPLWWVHLAPAESADIARTRLAALQARGIDSFRLAEGDYRNAISLGYFRSEENATRLRGEYQARDINAELVALPQSDEETWLAVGPVSGDNGRRIRAEAESATWRVESRECS